MANPITQIILSAVDRTKAAFTSAKGGLTSLGNAAASLRGVLANLFVGLSVVGFIGAVKRSVDSMDDAAKAAKAAGTSVENFSALTYAAGQSGVGPDALKKSLVGLATSLDDAKDGTGLAAEAFQRLNIDPKKFDDPADALLVLADRFASMPDGINKTALAAAIFGKKIGPEMIPLLNQGSAGIRVMTDEAERLGKVLKNETTAAAEEFNDNLDKLRSAGEGLGYKLAAELLPGLTQITRAMAEAAKEGSILNTLWVGLGGIGAALFTDDLLTNMQKLAKAQKELAEAADGARRAGIGDTGYITRKREEVRALAELVAAEKAAVADEKKLEEERRKNSKETTKALGENHKDEAKAFKDAVNEKISDAKRLQSALQSAFSDSIAAETNYRDEAKKLREGAANLSATGSDKSQESIRAEATFATMKLERLKANGSPEKIRDQAAAVKDLASNLDDAQYKTWLLQRAMLAEAAAADKSAAAEAEQSKGLAEQLRANEGRMAKAKQDAEDIGKPVSVDVNVTPQTDASLEKLREIKRLVDVLKDTPINLNVSTSGNDSTANFLRDAALEYGRR